MVATPQRTNAKRRTKPGGKDSQITELPARDADRAGGDRDRAGVSADSAPAATNGTQEPVESEAAGMVQGVSLVPGKLFPRKPVEVNPVAVYEQEVYYSESKQGAWQLATPEDIKVLKKGDRVAIADHNWVYAYLRWDTVEAEAVVQFIGYNFRTRIPAGKLQIPCKASNEPHEFEVNDLIVGKTATEQVAFGRYKGVSSSGLLRIDTGKRTAAITPESATLIEMPKFAVGDRVLVNAHAPMWVGIEAKIAAISPQPEYEKALESWSWQWRYLLHSNNHTPENPDHCWVTEAYLERLTAQQSAFEVGDRVVIRQKGHPDLHGRILRLNSKDEASVYVDEFGAAALVLLKFLFNEVEDQAESSVDQDPEAIEPLTPVEVVTADARDRLTQLEADIQEGLNLVEQGKSKIWQAVAAVRAEKLWRLDGHTSFEAYCKSRWGWEKSNAHEVAQAGEVVAGLLESGIPESQLPDSVSQTRELSKILPEKRAEVLQRAAAQTEGKPTAKAIREATTPEEVQEKYRKVEDVVMPQLAELKVLYEAIGLVKDWKDGFTVERPDLGNPFPLAFKNRTQAWDYWRRHKEKLQGLAERKPIPETLAIAPEIQTLKPNIQTLEPPPQECWHHCFVVVRSSVRSFSNFQQKGWSDEAIESLTKQVIEFLSIAEV